MRFGLMFFAASEDALDNNKYALVIKSARFGDQHGFSSIWVPERHFTALGSLYPNPAVLQAALARETQRIHLRAGSVVLPLHHPIRVAEEWSVVDNLSEGRVGISFASGWNPNDFAFFPERYQHRHAEMLNAIRTVQQLWRGETIRIATGNGDMADLRIYPTPVQPELPIWVTAAGSPQTFVAAGAIGANLLTHVLDQSIETLAERITLYRYARAEHGHDPDAGLVTVMMHTFVGHDAAAVREQAREPYCRHLKSNIGLLKGLAQSRGQSFDITTMSAGDIDAFVDLLYDRFATERGLIGTPATCVDVIRHMAEAGVDEIACLLDFGPPADVILQNLPYLKQLKEHCETELGDRVRQRAVLSVSEPAPFRPESLAEVQSRCIHEIPTDRFYRDLRRQGVRMDAAFQGIDRLWRHEREALGLIRMPAALLPATEQYTLHPALLDACLQVFVAALPPSILSNNGALYLPNGLRRLRIHGSIGERLWSHAVLYSAADRSESTFEGNVRVFDEAGNIVVEIDGLRLQQVAAPRSSSSDPLNDWFYDINWHPKPLPSTPAAPDQAGRWIIFADQGGISARLITQLKQRGEECLVVLPHGCANSQDHAAVVIDPCNPQAMHQLLQEALSSSQYPCRGIIHMWSLDTTSPAATTLVSLNQDYQHSMLSALYLVQALQTLGSSKARLWFVTRAAQSVGSSMTLPAIAQSPLWGLARSLPLELPQLWTGLIDLDGDVPEDTAAAGLFDAVWNPDQEDQVAFRGGQRFVARLERDDDFTADQPEIFIRADATYVITGGLGNLGQHFAHWLADRGGRHLVLLGRSAASQTTSEALDRLKQMGIRIQIFNADVADPVVMADVFDELAERWPPVRGIIHAAGTTSYQTVERLDAGMVAQMLRPKVFGTWVIYELCQAKELDFFVCISSLSPVWGSKGLGHYAAANHFLDIFAHYGRRLKLPVTTINLGPVAGGGMAAATVELQQVMTQSGLHLLEPGLALDASAAVIRAAAAQKIVVDVEWATFRQLHEISGPRPLLELVEPGAAANNSQTALHISAFSQRLAQAAPGEQAELLIAHVQDQVSHVLKLGTASRPDPLQGFFDMGMDSLMVLDLRNRLQNSLGQSLPTTLLFEYPTIETLTSYLLDHLFGRSGETEITDSTSAQQQPDDLAAVAGLSEDELKQLIDAELDML